MISDTPSSLVSDDGSNNWVVPFFCYYPERCDLNRKQSACYKKIKEELDNGKYVDIGESRSYIFLYINEFLKKVKKKKDIERVIKVLESLRELYKSDKSLMGLIVFWLADSYVIKGDLDKAMSIYRGSYLLSLKYHLRHPVNVRELYFPKVSKIKGFTGFVRDKYDLIEKYIDFICQRDGLNKDWFEDDWIHKKIEETRREQRKVFLEYPLFHASRYGYHMSKLNEDIKFISFDSLLKDKAKIEKQISREAENMLRQDMGIPWVGQGWRNETELYYKVQKFLRNYEVIQHYKSEWLGRQHLDIYIPELRLGIEYQGKQHFEPVAYFGGDEAFIENQKRDAAKKEKCSQANVTLLEVHYDYDFGYVKYQIKKHMENLGLLK